jgi:hypothetical protein
MVDQPGVRVHPSPYFALTSPPLTYTLSEKLHASDLRALSPSSSLATRLQDSPSSMQLPYVRFPPAPAHHTTPAPPLQDFVNKLAALCGAQSQRFAFPTTFESSLSSSSQPSSKHVLWMSMPAVTKSAGARKRSVAEHGTYAMLLASAQSYSTTQEKLTGQIWLPARGPPCD